MQDFETTWKTYATSWKTTSEAERLALLERTLERGCRYIDPQTDVTGHPALSASMAEFQAQFPGFEFVTTQFWTHGNRSLARWEMRASSGAVVSDGASYAEFGDTGKLTAITGFFAMPSE
jgi:hypothetical protein